MSPKRELINPRLTQMSYVFIVKHQSQVPKTHNKSLQTMISHDKLSIHQNFILAI